MSVFTQNSYYRMNMTVVALYAYMSTQPLYKCAFVTTFSVMVLLTAIICELTVFYTKGFQIVTFVDVVPTVIVNGTCLLYMPLAYSTRKRLDKIYEIVECNFARNWDQGEIAAKLKFEKLSDILVKLISFTMIIGPPLITVWALTPQFLDIILSINGTRQRVLPFPGEFFVDEEKYFYQILFFQYVISCVVTLIIGSLESMFVTVVYFVCGMFAVIGYRLENILQNHPGTKDQGKMIDEGTLIGSIRRCMKDYRTMKECITLMNSCAGLLIPCLLIATVVSFSISLVQVTNVELVNPRSVLFAIAQIAQFFIISLVAQTLINSSMTLPKTTYYARWYDCPIKIQKMFILILLAIHKPTAITARNMFILCLENFGAVTQTAMSYFMVIRQFQ